MKVLIIDDSESIRTQLRRFLPTYVEAFEAENGIKALNVVDKHPDIKLIFCDVNMPDMDGITFSQTIHRNPKFKDVPIIMVTTESNEELKKKGKEAGVRAWIVKPFTSEKIQLAVERFK